MSLPKTSSDLAGRLMASAFAVVLLAGAATSSFGADKDPIAVTIDRAKVMRISRPADVVIIGNPAIADATIQDNMTLIITGRSYGTTNLIVLDASGQPIADEIVNVSPSNENVVTIFKRASRETLSCTPDCAPTLVIGDRPEVFTTVGEQISSHGAISDAAAK